MRKINIIFACLLMAYVFSSCKSSELVTSKEAFKAVTLNIQTTLANDGYLLTNESIDAVYWTYDKFVFSDSVGNEVSFILKYNDKTDYVTPVEVTECSSNKNYSKFCGTTGIIRTEIDSLNNHPDKTVKVRTIGKSFGHRVILF